MSATRTTLRVEEVEKLSLSPPGLLEAYRCGLMLQEKGWMLYPAASWDAPAILAFENDRCVAGINWSKSDSDNHAAVDFAWCSPDRPDALTACLLRFRRLLRAHPPAWLSFTCHTGNAPMEKLVERMRLRPHSRSYRVPSSYYAAKDAKPQPQSKLRAMLLSALKSVEARIAQ